jgi:hypothetical protein
MMSASEFVGVMIMVMRRELVEELAVGKKIQLAHKGNGFGLSAAVGRGMQRRKKFKPTPQLGTNKNQANINHQNQPPNST